MGNDSGTGETPNGQTSTGGVSGIPALEAKIESGTPTTSTTPTKQPAQPNETTIDWSKLDVSQIPADVIEKHAAYKAVLSESIERRKTIQQLKQTPTEASGEAVSDGNKGVDKLAQLEASVNKLIELQERDALTRTRDLLAAKYNVPANRVQYIAGSTAEELEKSAKDLGEEKRSGGVTGNAGAGNGAGDGDVLGAMKNRIRAKMQDKGVENPSPFEAGVQRLRGGGPVQK